MDTPTTRVRPGRANLFFAAATGALFLAGCLLLAHWLRARDAARAPLPAAAAPPPLAATEPSPQVAAWLGGPVAWGPARPDDFGGNPAVLVSGHAAPGPETVFPAMIGAPLDAGAEAAAFAQGPSARAALRLQATVGAMPQGAFLLRLAPDLDALARGALRTEPGAVTLAFPGSGGWSYATWVFPEGLDLDGLRGAWRAPPDALRDLPAAHRLHVEPLMAFGGRAGPRTVLCRARGRAADAVAALSDLMEARGWVRRFAAEREGRGVVRVLESGPRQVWLAAGPAPAADQTEGGLVSVMLGS